jgi:hypothetical protein
MREFLVTRQMKCHLVSQTVQLGMQVRFLSVMHLNAMTASRKYKHCRTGSHFSSCRIGVTLSYLPTPLTVRQAKFCTTCTLFKFV